MKLSIALCKIHLKTVNGFSLQSITRVMRSNLLHTSTLRDLVKIVGQVKLNQLLLQIFSEPGKY